MTRALITQLFKALAAQHEDRTAYSSSKRRATATCGSFTTNSLQELIESGYMQRMGKETSAAITAAREYLETEPKPTLKETLAQQGIKLRTEFEPKQRDSELATEPSGERAELIANLRSQECCQAHGGTGSHHTRCKECPRNVVDMLEADALELTRLRDLARDASNAATELQKQVLVLKAQQANKPTGWDNGLSQDYCAEFGQWLASRPGARQQIKEMFDAPEEEDLYTLALKADNWGQP